VTPFDFYVPTRIRFGAGRLAELGAALGPDAGRLFVVTDAAVATRTRALDLVRAALDGRTVRVFDGVEENPSIESVDAAGRDARDFGAATIIGLGGGSPMDAAKGVALVAATGRPLRDHLGGLPPDVPPLPVVAIPTTSGTGSEVTPYAVFTDRQAANKIGYSHPGIFPAIALVDPELTSSMPAPVALNTGLDALAHALEAYLSTAASALSDVVAIEAATVVLADLGAAVRKDAGAMVRMSYAAMLAGIAIAHASTVLPHIMGYPLTVFHGVPHGRASAVMLAHVLDALPACSTCPEKLRRVERLLAPHGGMLGYLRGLGVPTALEDYGVRADEIALYAGKTIVKGDVQITPATVTVEWLESIYRAALTSGATG